MGLFIVREGEGEDDALPSLVPRLRIHHGLDALPFVPRNGSWKKFLVTESQVRDACQQMRGQGSCQALLLTRDADNDDLPNADCPRFAAPRPRCARGELLVVVPATRQRRDLPLPEPRCPGCCLPSSPGGRR